MISSSKTGHEFSYTPNNEPKLYEVFVRASFKGISPLLTPQGSVQFIPKHFIFTPGVEKCLYFMRPKAIPFLAVTTNLRINWNRREIK